MEMSLSYPEAGRMREEALELIAREAQAVVSIPSFAEISNWE